MGNRESGPVLAESGASLQHRTTALDVSLVVPHLHLEQREITLNGLRFGLKAQSKSVGLDGLLVVLFLAVQQPIDVPGDMRLHVISKSLLGERKGLLRLPNLAHVE